MFWYQEIHTTNILRRIKAIISIVNAVAILLQAIGLITWGQKRHIAIWVTGHHSVLGNLPSDLQALHGLALDNRCFKHHLEGILDVLGCFDILQRVIQKQLPSKVVHPGVAFIANLILDADLVCEPKATFGILTEIIFPCRI